MRRPFSLALATVALGAGLVLGSVGASAQDAEILDCEDFSSQSDAQAAYREDPSDPAGNDADGDGIACELFDGFADSATDLIPIDASEEADAADTLTGTGADADTTTSEVSAVAAAGVGSSIAGATGGTGMAAVAAALAGAAGCGAVALRGVRSARSA